MVEGIIAETLRHQRFQAATSPSLVFEGAHEFEMTVEMMRVVTRACHAKRPKTKNSRSNRLYQEICTYCGEATELAEQSLLNYDQEDTSRLSGKYCSKHRPKFRDGRRNSEYLKAVRHAEEYDNEVRRITLQSTCLSKPNAQTGDRFLDSFYFKLVSSHATFADETQFINNQARALIDERITDNKKKMIMMRASGLSLSAIAGTFELRSRQAVGKAIISVPCFYRFDIKAAPPPSEKVFDGLNANFLAAIRDSDIVEIQLNPDGKLWAESSDTGRRHIGHISASEAKEIIQRVADQKKGNANSESCVVIADIPTARIRFTGTLPPVTENPAFAISKMAPDD